jgi:hypothetical protein
VTRENTADRIPIPRIRRIEADRYENLSNLEIPSIKITNTKMPMGKCTKTG